MMESVEPQLTQRDLCNGLLKGKAITFNRTITTTISNIKRPSRARTSECEELSILILVF
jgi:hypothetical protein